MSQCPWCKAPLRNPAEPICGKCGLAIPRTTKNAATQKDAVPLDPLQQTYSSAQEGAAILAVQRRGPEVTLKRSIIAFVIASVAAIIACVGWVIVAIVTGMEFGLLAWGIGGLIGFVAGVIAKNSSPVFCFLVAGLAGMSILGAKIIMAIFLMLISFGVATIKEWAQFGPDYVKISHAVQDEMLAEGQFEGRQKEIAEEQVRTFFGNLIEDSVIPPADLDARMQDQLAISEKVNARIMAMTQPEKDAVLVRARQRYPGWLENDYQYAAIVDSLVTSGELTDAALAAHAQSELKELGGEFDLEYEQTVAERERNRRSNELHRIAAEKKLTLDDRQLDELLRQTIRHHMQWVPIHDEYIAVLEKMHRENQFSGELAQHAKRTLDLQLDSDPVNGTDEVDFDALQRREAQLAAQVNEQFVTMDATQRKALVDDLKTRFPTWNSLLGGADADLNELDEALKDAGADGTFFGSFKQVFRLIDFLWLFLGISTAFGVAYKQGEG